MEDISYERPLIILYRLQSTEGSFVQRYGNEHEAAAMCDLANIRAERLGVSTRYELIREHRNMMRWEEARYHNEGEYPKG